LFIGWIDACITLLLWTFSGVTGYESKTADGAVAAKPGMDAFLNYGWSLDV
jgi:hypothetical protein